jgi:hypothetical protein
VDQEVISAPLPPNLNLILNAKTTLTVGAFTQVFGDVGSSGLNGSLLFDVSSSQGFDGNALANTVTVRTSASVGHVFGNDITVDGLAFQQSLGLDPATLPPVPGMPSVAPGTTNVSLATNQTRQLCPGSYGTLSLGQNARLNLNGGVYQVARLNLADGARLEPSEPVVILVSGSLVTHTGSLIAPSGQSLNAMSAADIRIEVAGAVTLGDSTQVRAHLLVPNGKLTTGGSVSLIGAAWAKSIAIGTQNFITGEGRFSTETPVVPPPCNDNNVCTADQCVSAGTVAFCRNTPAPSGTSCDDGNLCNGVAVCDGAGACAPGTVADPGTSCTDANVCNGDETCDGFGTCQAGAPPVVTDENTCTVDVCDPQTGVSHLPVPDGTTCSGIGVCEGGVCSIQAQMLVTINDANGHLERIDRDTFSVTDIGPLGVGYAFGDCAWNPVDRALYMVDGRGVRGLYRVDLLTGAATLVGIHGRFDLFSLAYHPPTNQLYGLDGVGDLYSISTTTGAATRIGHSIDTFVDGLAFDSTRNQLVALTAGASAFFAVDVTTAVATRLQSVPFIDDMGLTYDPTIDRFWVADFRGNLTQFNPEGNQFSQTTLASLPGSRTCLALVTATR